MFQPKCSLILLFFLFSLFGKAQESAEFSRTSYLFSLGAGYNSVSANTGGGPLLSFSRFTNSRTNRYKWGWSIQHGEFYPYGINGAREAYYTMTSVGYTAGMDLVRIKHFSIFLNALAFIDVYRNVSPKNAYGIEPAISGGGEMGLRYSHPGKRFGYQLTYVQARFGTGQAEMASVNLCLEVRLRK